MDRDRTVIYFLAVLLCAAVPAAVAVFTTDKLALHASLNAEHQPLGEWFFAWFTHLADGLVPTALALTILILRDLRSFLLLGGSCALSAIIVQVLKRQVFPGHDRPVKFLDVMPAMDWVQGIELHHHFSFPSGHSTAAFSMCLALAVIIGRPAWGFALALLASALAYSRVYLSQHFTEDVLAGAFLGAATTLALYHLLYKGRGSTKAWLDHRLRRQRNQ
ncbi:MAG: phosphatase PAP2 family protein [Flavobacteriales bacterium]|nr:phosphatase PAP2 family protein [Flavobacteriales bacterium]